MPKRVNYHNYTKEEWTEAIRAGDDRALTWLNDNHRNVMIRARMKDWDGPLLIQDFEDAFQEAFIAFCKKVREKDLKYKPGTLLQQIFFYKSVDCFRNKVKRKEKLSDPVAPTFNRADAADSSVDLASDSREEQRWRRLFIKEDCKGENGPRDRLLVLSKSFGWSDEHLAGELAKLSPPIAFDKTKISKATYQVKQRFLRFLRRRTKN